MRTSLGLAALVFGLSLASAASAQDMSDYGIGSTKMPKPKPKPQPTMFQKVKNFTIKAFDYNTYLPAPGTTDNSIRDPRLLPNKSPSETLVDFIDVARPQDPVKFYVP
jgi:hypothetical protein